MSTQPESIPAPLRFNLINRTAVREYALHVSRERRAGKFTRVGASFLDAVEADLDAAIRQISPDRLLVDPLPPPTRSIITGQVLARCKEKFNHLAHVIIYRKVVRHPSLGRTLKD